MLGKQSGLDGGEHAYLDHVGRDSFYGFLASHRRELFHDEDFIDLYCSDNGRPSVPPSLMATALLLQAYEGVSDEEAKARADFDLRWKVALGIGLEERPFAKSTLQLFRARLILHERVREHDLGRYFGSSLKGEAGIDWDDPEARQVFLEGVVADADRLLMVVREAMEKLPADEPLRQRLHEAAGLLARLLMQDIERREDGTRLKQGVSSDRIVSVHDPEMRHGRKSARRRFDGHKAAIAVDPESQLITAADVLAGNAPDHEQAIQLVEQTEANAGAAVKETAGDCAYGDGNTRQLFADAGRRLVAKVASRRGQAQFPKEDFRIDLETMSCTCPAGQETRKVVSISSGDRYGAPGLPLRAFRF